MTPETHLSFFYEDVPDGGLALRFSIVHPHIVDLVAPDLTMPQAGGRSSPRHPNGRGVHGVGRYRPRRTTRNYKRTLE